jgi:hypothetical protein
MSPSRAIDTSGQENIVGIQRRCDIELRVLSATKGCLYHRAVIQHRAGRGNGDIARLRNIEWRIETTHECVSSLLDIDIPESHDSREGVVKDTAGQAIDSERAIAGISIAKQLSSVVHLLCARGRDHTVLWTQQRDPVREGSDDDSAPYRLNSGEWMRDILLSSNERCEARGKHSEGRELHRAHGQLQLQWNLWQRRGHDGEREKRRLSSLMSSRALYSI